MRGINDIIMMIHNLTIDGTINTVYMFSENLGVDLVSGFPPLKLIILTKLFIRIEYLDC